MPTVKLPNSIDLDVFNGNGQPWYLYKERFVSRQFMGSEQWMVTNSIFIYAYLRPYYAYADDGFIICKSPTGENVIRTQGAYASTEQRVLAYLINSWVVDIPLF